MNNISDLDKVIDRRNTDATKYVELTEKYGRSDLLPMWIADMDFRSPDSVREELISCFHQPVLGYTTAPESFWQSITDWLAKRHDWIVRREEIDFVPGLKKGLGLCLNYFTQPGDNIVIQPPVYHSFRSVIEGNNRCPIDNPLLYDGKSYKMDFDGLERIIEEKHPVMLIICNPHNPIGIQWDRETLARVVDICYRNNIILLSDEIYGDLVFKTSRHIPTASISEKAADITVSLGAPSKSFNIPGIASAWAVIQSPRLREGFFKWLHASEFDTPPIDAIYATRAAYTTCESWLDNVLGYLDSNAQFACDYLAENLPCVRTIRPDGGFGLWIDFNPTGLNHDRLCDIFVNEALIAVSDGAGFGAEGSGFIRLNIGVPRSVLIDGLERITKAIKSNIA